MPNRRQIGDEGVDAVNLAVEADIGPVIGERTPFSTRRDDVIFKVGGDAEKGLFERLADGDRIRRPYDFAIVQPKNACGSWPRILA